MRKLFYLAIILVLLAIPFRTVSAQVPASYKSTVNVTNISNTAGTITLNFYNSSGTVVGTLSDVSIAAYETKWISSFGSLASGFDGALVISSSVPLASMSMLSGLDSGDDTKNYASYIGTSAGSNFMYLPLLMEENFGYSTYYYVQNTSSSSVNVSIAYSDGTTNSITALPPSASVKIDNSIDEDHTPLSFSAKLTATGPIAVAVVEYSDGYNGDQLYAYSGFSEGSENPIFTMINENNAGYWTSANIQNVGDTSTNVTITYIPTQSGTQCTETQTIPAGEKRDFATYAFAFDPSGYSYSLTTDCVMSEKFIGIGVVTGNSAGQDLVGINNQINITNDPNKGAALMSLSADFASDTVVFPYVRQWDGSENWWSSWTIINVSGGTLAAGDIVCRVTGSDTSGAVDTTISNPTALADGEGWLQQFYDSYPPLSNGFVGGAVCVASGDIVGQVNILAAGAGVDIDSLAAFEGINP